MSLASSYWASYKKLDLAVRWLIAAIFGIVIFVSVGAATKAFFTRALPSDEFQVAQNGAPYVMAPNNNGIITQGQTGGSNTIIQGAVARHLDDGLKDQLLAHISKDRKVSVTFASTASDGGDLAAEIKNFLEADGYSVTGPAMGFFAGSQPHGIIVSLHNDDLAKPVEILIGTQ